MKLQDFEEDFSPLALTDTAELDYVEISDGRASLFFPRVGYLFPIEQHELAETEKSDPEVQYDMRQLFVQIQSDFDLSDELARQVMAEQKTVGQAVREQRGQVPEILAINGNGKKSKKSKPVVTVVDSGYEDIPKEWDQKIFIQNQYPELYRRMYMKAAQREQNSYIDTAVTLFMRHRRLYHVKLLENLPISTTPITVQAQIAISLKAGEYIKFGAVNYRVAQTAKKPRNGKVSLTLTNSEVELSANTIGFVADYSNDLEVKLGYRLWTVDHTLRTLWLGDVLKAKIYDLFLDERESGEKKLLALQHTLPPDIPDKNNGQNQTAPAIQTNQKESLPIA